jgi:hypothetical protein
MILIDVEKDIQQDRPDIFFVFITHARLIVGEQYDRPRNGS